MHSPGLAEFMHSDNLFKLTAYLKVCILSLFCSICILLDFWCSMISAVFCLAGCIYIIDYYSFQYFDNEFNFFIFFRTFTIFYNILFFLIFMTFSGVCWKSAAKGPDL
ncbi:hypothetical protein CXB51_025962 [Gossypium anomalum]|uniref:Uncharacterized protein n=1 Tax=Gossypium anomalum TaxID=47600 RepID=A0A8J6CN82_9ROSI|nr:hypothetical protein CXB51_025962 [Gossypium anomalum]